MTFSTLLTYFCPLLGALHYLGDDGQTGYCLHKVAREHVAKHPLRVLILCMPPPSTFSALVQEQIPGPSPLVLKNAPGRAFSSAIWIHSCPHHWDPVLP